MNLHLVTIIYIAAFLTVSALVALGLNTYPIITLTVFAIVMFCAFYHLVYTMLKLERAMKELKSK